MEGIAMHKIDITDLKALLIFPWQKVLISFWRNTALSESNIAFKNIVFALLRIKYNCNRTQYWPSI